MKNQIIEELYLNHATINECNKIKEYLETKGDTYRNLMIIGGILLVTVVFGVPFFLWGLIGKLKSHKYMKNVKLYGDNKEEQIENLKNMIKKCKNKINETNDVDLPTKYKDYNSINLIRTYMEAGKSKTIKEGVKELDNWNRIREGRIAQRERLKEILGSDGYTPPDYQARHNARLDQEARDFRDRQYKSQQREIEKLKRDVRRLK